MTDPTTTAPVKTAPAPMPVGGAVTAIVPQTFEEIQRISNQVIVGGLAPASLIKFPKSDETPEEVQAMGRRNVAAVSGVLMAGAELGVPPMAALRLFTSINGRAALYADGNVAVVRRARDRDGKLICAYIKQGFIRGETDEDSLAWCEAKRADNEEIHREEYSIADAKQAGLWDDKEFKRAKVWRNGKNDWHDDVPNDSAWHRFPKRMLLWRATGYCLRWLFADVLAGMVDEFEARDIEGMIDITPAAAQERARPTPPPPPTDDEDDPTPPAASGEATQASADGMDQSTGETETPASDAPDEGTAYSEEFLADLETLLGQAKNPEEIETAFDKADPHKELAGDEDALARAFTIKKDAIAKLRADLEAQGQGSMFTEKPFPGDK